MATKRGPGADLSSSLDGWDVAEASGDMLAGWDDGPSSASEASSVATWSAVPDDGSASAEKKPRARRKPAAVKRSAAAKPSSRRSGSRKQDNESTSTVDIGEPIAAPQMDPSADASPAAVDSIVPVALDDGAPDADLLDVETGADSAVVGETSNDGSLSSRPDLAADADSGTGVGSVSDSTTDHESWTPVVDEADLAIDGVDDLIDDSGESSTADKTDAVDSMAAGSFADIEEPMPVNSIDSGRLLGDAAGAATANVPHRFETPVRSQSTASAPAVSRPMPVSEPEPIHEDSEDDGLQMFLGDERDYVIERDLRSRTKAEAAARNAFRLHRPGAGAMRSAPTFGAAAGMAAVGSSPQTQNGSIADLNDGGLAAASRPTIDDPDGTDGVMGSSALQSAETMRSSLGGDPTGDYPQGSFIDGSSDPGTVPAGSGYGGYGAEIVDGSQADDSPALDYDGLLNDMNADNSGDYLNVDSPSVIDGDEADEDEAGSAGCIDDDLEEERSPEEYAERIASLSKSAPSQPIEDPVQRLQDEDTEAASPADDDQRDDGSTDVDKGNGKSSLKDKFHALIAQAKSEIGASSDDEPNGGDDDDGTAGKPSRKSKKKPAEAPAQNEAKGRGPLSAVHGVISKIRTVKRAYRIAVTLGLVFAGLWTSLNVPAAMDKGGATGEAVDEGSVKVAAASWNGSAVEVTLQNDSEMIAHVSGSAVVKSWSPSASPVSWIGARVTATCEIPATDVDPGASKTVKASRCDAKPTGVWRRVKATLDYE